MRNGAPDIQDLRQSAASKGGLPGPLGHPTSRVRWVKNADSKSDCPDSNPNSSSY